MIGDRIELKNFLYTCFDFCGFTVLVIPDAGFPDDGVPGEADSDVYLIRGIFYDNVVHDCVRKKRFLEFFKSFFGFGLYWKRNGCDGNGVGRVDAGERGDEQGVEHIVLYDDVAELKKRVKSIVHEGTSLDVPSACDSLRKNLYLFSLP